MNIYRINTTAFDEEDFFIITDLEAKDIERVIMPIVHRERGGGDGYDNETITLELIKTYPFNKVYMYCEIPKISI
jgi:hypothetical protein